MSDFRLGVDPGDTAALVARVDYRSFPAVVTALGEYARGERIANSLYTDTPTIFAVSDDAAITKVVEIAPVDPSLAEVAARFELTSSLLGPVDDFCTAVFPLSISNERRNGDSRWLASATRRLHLDNMRREWLGDPPASDNTLFASRAMALGRGFLCFCEPIPEGTSAVIDVSDRATSICLLNGSMILGAAHLRGLSSTNLLSESQADQWVSEFQTLVSFRLASDPIFAGRGSLSSVVIAGSTGDLLGLLGRRLTVPTFAAQIRPEFAIPEIGDSVPAIRWLVALGLTVN
jgi:hypothetical protein